MEKTKLFGFLLYLIFGIYFLNMPFGVIPMPDFITGISNWIVFVGGILIIAGGINYLRS